MMKPIETVNELNRHIVGQEQAKQAVSVALRNRWRRSQLPEDIRNEITPKNILMIGPTGVGKTEIARRLAILSESPFIKVEATKFTEVGYVGRDVDAIVRDLVENAIKMLREKEYKKHHSKAKINAEKRLLDAIVEPDRNPDTAQASADTREKFRKMLLDGKLENKEIKAELNISPQHVEIMAPPGMEEMSNQIQKMFQGMKDNKTKKTTISIKKARKIFIDEETNRLISEDELRHLAIETTEQNGIVFIDEIDKVAKRQEMSGGDVSREGVQRDLLPLIEGSIVSTKYGSIKTDHILFIASGAFHYSKPSDLIPELQGRLPIRVELNALCVEDFVAILASQEFSLIRQYTELLSTENLTLEFQQNAIVRIAEIAYKVNESLENIGARRLYTVMEKLLENISFNADEYHDQVFVIDVDYVNQQLNSLAHDQDLSQYIL